MWKEGRGESGKVSSPQRRWDAEENAEKTKTQDKDLRAQSQRRTGEEHAPWKGGMAPLRPAFQTAMGPRVVGAFFEVCSTSSPLSGNCPRLYPNPARAILRNAITVGEGANGLQHADTLVRSPFSGR